MYDWCDLEKYSKISWVGMKDNHER
jgi:hypothetical protein